MNNLDTRRYEMLVRVRDFGAAHKDLFPTRTTVGGKAFATITEAVEELTKHVASQLSGRGTAREGTTSKAVAREALRDEVDAIIRTARALALDDPGLDVKFKPPRSNGDQALISAARAFVVDAAPIAEAFVEHGMPKSFLKDLEGSIAELETAIQERNAGKETNVASQAAMEEAMEQGLGAVLRLDAVVTNTARGDASTLAAWELARRVTGRVGRGRGEAAEEGTTAPPAAAG